MSHFQIAYFPYISMNSFDEIDLGYLKVWNFEKKKDDYIKDEALKAKIEKIFATHITHHGQVRNIGVIQIAGKNFEPLDPKETLLIQEARVTLFLAFVSHNNTIAPNVNAGHSMATTENFDVVYQNFNLIENYVSETSGEIIRFTKGGYTLDKVRFLTPSFVPTPTNYYLDAEVFSELKYLKDHKPKIYRKIINSTQIFMEGYYNSHHLSNNARILLFMSAFEAIFSIPEEKQRKHFKENIQRISNIDGEKTYINYWDMRNKSKTLEYLTIKGLWAEKFYLLRNSIVHGDKVESKNFLFEKSQSHIDIALLFFVLAVKMQFEKSRKGFVCDYQIRWSDYTNEAFNPPKKMKIFIYRNAMKGLYKKLSKLGKKRI